MDTKTFHEDEDLRIEEERCAGIVVKDNKVLMIHRIKNGFEYYVFPGGHRRKGEASEDTTIREIKEETNIDVVNAKLVFEFNNHFSGLSHKYFLCEWKSGDKLELVGEESLRHCEENQYFPEWVNIEDISQLNVLPLFAKEWVVGEIVKK